MKFWFHDLSVVCYYWNTRFLCCHFFPPPLTGPEIYNAWFSCLLCKSSEEWKSTAWWWPAGWATSRVQAAVIVCFFGVSCGWWVFLRSYGAPDGKVGFSFMQFFMVLDSFSSLDPIVWIYWESISSFSHPFWENVGLYYSQGCCDLLLLEFHSRYLKYIIGCALLLLFFLLIYLFTILLTWIYIEARSSFFPLLFVHFSKKSQVFIFNAKLKG